MVMLHAARELGTLVIISSCMHVCVCGHDVHGAVFSGILTFPEHSKAIALLLVRWPFNGHARMCGIS